MQAMPTSEPRCGAGPGLESKLAHWAHLGAEGCSSPRKRRWLFSIDRLNQFRHLFRIRTGKYTVDEVCMPRLGYLLSLAA
jgi:hypothetical protein